ncbi:hypothetical protein IU449_01190 [Nocardia higoensis]|uniref:Uncharacterized protein n=1 Tax=Nocardia higoensis TaxID=228599 RepID=A0ABS0D3W3_9NOCA|nr:hypothetical protein [Nocardia higoensis]MBF6353175.1 hypothetical protein [Nocardia higoensis]
MTEPRTGSADGVLAADAIGAANNPSDNATAVVANNFVNLDIFEPFTVDGS